MSIDYGQAPSQTSISASPSSVSEGGSVTYSASVTGMIGTPNLGTVEFTVDGTALCAVTLSDGSASCSSSGAPVGNDTITGTYFGNPFFSGSTGTTTLTVNAPAPPPPPPVTSPSIAHGYWLVGSDGGIFSFGSAQFYGSMGGNTLKRPVVGIRRLLTAAARLDASDGGVFASATPNSTGRFLVWASSVWFGPPNSLTRRSWGWSLSGRRRLLHGWRDGERVRLRRRQVRREVPGYPAAALAQRSPSCRTPPAMAIGW